MQTGVIFPQTEVGDDPGAVRAYAEGVEALGYRHLLAYEHVLGTDPAVHQGFDGPYNVHSSFHEPLVTFGFLAAVTRLELVSGVLILPQRQTVLVAKQTAEVDLLSEGRLRLGVGLGWNRVEYDALDKPFGDRGRRLEEQISLLRRLWTEPSLSFEGRWEQVQGAGIKPLPVQRPIPVWIGASSPPALARAGRIADGWFPGGAPGPALDAARAVVSDAARQAGRDPASLGMDGRVALKGAGDDDVAAAAGLLDAWEAAGATHVSVNTMDAGLGGVDGHLRALGALAQARGLTAVPRA